MPKYAISYDSSNAPEDFDDHIKVEAKRLLKDFDDVVSVEVDGDIIVETTSEIRTNVLDALDDACHYAADTLSDHYGNKYFCELDRKQVREI